MPQTTRTFAAVPPETADVLRPVLSGLADETMLRDAAYAFLAAGRHSESAEMIVRMLRVALAAGAEADDDPATRGDRALALLQAVGGLEAFRRADALPVEPEPVAEFILKLTGGRADALSGRFFNPRLDFEHYVRDADRIVREDLWTLRITGKK